MKRISIEIKDQRNMKKKGERRNLENEVKRERKEIKKKIKLNA